MSQPYKITMTRKPQPGELLTGRGGMREKVLAVIRQHTIRGRGIRRGQTWLEWTVLVVEVK